MTELICAGWVLDGKGRQFKEYGLLVEEGKILQMGPDRELLRRYPRVKVTKSTDWVLAPGYLDAHDHGRALSPFWFGVRDCPLELWIPRLSAVAVPPYEAALYDGIQLAKSGVTTVVHCHNPLDIKEMERELLDVARGYLDAGIRVVLCPPYTDQNALVYEDREVFLESLPPDQREEFQSILLDKPMELGEYFDLIQGLREKLNEEIETGRVEIQLHPVGGQWCSDEALIQIRDYGIKHRMRVHMHLLETRYQRIYGYKRWRKSTVAHLEEIGVLGPWLTLAHGIWMEESDWDLLRKWKVKVVTNPSSNLRLSSGVLPLQKMRERGVACGIGLDGCTLDDDQDYGRELRLAACNPGVLGVTAQITAREVMEMAYQFGAEAVGGNLSGGSLKAGERADFICFSQRKLEFPYADSSLTLEEKILKRGGRRTIEAVYCGGKRIIHRGESTSAVERSVGEAIAQWIQERSSSAGISEGLMGALRDFYRRWEESERGIVQ